MVGNNSTGGESVVIVTFGVERGQEIETVPVDYLRWALENLKLTARLQVILEDELIHRGEPVPDRPPPVPLPVCHKCHCVAAPGWKMNQAGVRSLAAFCRRCREWRGALVAFAGWARQADEEAARQAEREGA